MPAADILFSLGRPFSPLYAAIMRLREGLYRRGIFSVTKLGVPVVSIGNLTLGGTGKTPMVLRVARLCQGLGLRSVIVSRGYGGMAKEPVNVVSDGERVLLPAKIAGDEPRLLAESLPGVPVLVARRRSLGGLCAEKDFRADVVLLDDGFQHLALHRDLDIVLFRANSPFGNNRVFPGGDLREPVSALSRAHCFVVTGADESNRDGCAVLRQELARLNPAAPFFEAGYRPCSFVAGDETPLPAGALPEGPVLAFCGLASPDNFRRSLSSTGIEIADFIPFADHHPYTMADLAALAARANAVGARSLVTTGKDLVKLRNLESPLPLYALAVELVPDQGFDHFLEHELRRLRGSR